MKVVLLGPSRERKERWSAKKRGRFVSRARRSLGRDGGRGIVGDRRRLVADVGEHGLENGVVRLLSALQRVLVTMSYTGMRQLTYAECRKLEPEDEHALERIIPARQNHVRKIDVVKLTMTTHQGR